MCLLALLALVSDVSSQTGGLPNPGLGGGTPVPGCTLADLFLHSNADVDGNAAPIDVFEKVGTQDTFWARMDYQMLGFDLDARAVPSDSCEVRNLPSSTTMVDMGSTVSVVLHVANSYDQDTTPKSFQIDVSRPRGTETTLTNLNVADATMVPVWDPDVRNYTVYIDLSVDVVKVIFDRFDSGQIVGMSSGPQTPATPGRRLGGALGDLGPAIGEVQHTPSAYETMIDVGQQRDVLIGVTSPDGSTSASYRLRVKRPMCPRSQRFFDGARRQCTDVCNEGYFGNAATGRCTACPDINCAVCSQDDAAGACSQCFEGFTVVAGGSCTPADAPSGLEVMAGVGSKVQSYGSQHQSMMVGAFSGLVLVVCGCLAFACGRRRRPKSLMRTDTEDFDGYETSDDNFYASYPGE